ncbi:MAG: hypothetical protein ACOCWG_05765 [bacterium]
MHLRLYLLSVRNISQKSVLDLANEFYKRKELPNLSILVNDVSIQGYYGYNYGYRYGYSFNYDYNYGGYYNEEAPKITFLERLFKRS